MRHLTILFSLWMISVVAAYAQQNSADTIPQIVNGTVVDPKNEPIPGAKVEIVGTNDFATTDIDGKFRISTDQHAKKVRVRYVAYKTVNQKIKPDMVIKMGRSWRQGPENYQWFAGINIGGGRVDNFYDSFLENRTALTYSVSGGRVKNIGWYAKYSFYHKNSFSVNSFTLGGIFRLWCPLHFYLGFGPSNLHLSSDLRAFDYKHWSANINSGFMFRIKDFGISYDVLNTLGEDYNFYSVNLGLSYFFK